MIMKVWLRHFVKQKNFPWRVHNDIRIYRYKAWAQHINDGVAFNKRASGDSLLYYDKAIEEYKKSVVIWPDTSLTYFLSCASVSRKG